VKCNEAWWDRALRVVIGSFLISLVFWGPKSLWGLLGLLQLVTGLVGYCVLYEPFRLDTRKLGRRQ
jgi:hypothetical protein